MNIPGLILIALALQTPQTALPRDSDLKPTPGTGVISGVVVNDEARPQPVRRVVVTLTGDVRPSRGAITDDDGRFSIRNLPPGRYTVTVARPSFITSVYGAKRPGRPGTSIALAAGQAIDNLTVKIWRGAAVAGVLRDDTGAPVEGVTVTAVPARAARVAGVLTLSNNSEARTNDRGEFRIFGLEPGVYVIAARPPTGGRAPIHAMSEADVDAALDAVRRRSTTINSRAAQPAPPQSIDYVPVYFPGTPTLAQAAPITLGAGQEVAGLDFALQRVPTVFVEGMIARPDGQPAPGVSVQLSAVMSAGPFAAGSPLVLTATSGPDGAFRINQVTPGDYDLLARGSLQAAPPSDRGGFVTPGPAGGYWAQTAISVGGTDVRGLALTLEPGVTVRGTVVFEGDSLKPPANLTLLRIGLFPPSVLSLPPGASVNTIAFSPSVAVRADGSFEIPNLAPGTYRLIVSGAGLEKSGWIPRSALMAGRDLLDVDFQLALTASPASVAITFSDRSAELSGVLQTASGVPASDVFVIAFAADSKFWGPGARRVKAVRPGNDGQFLLSGLPPGDYLLAALSDVDENEWHDAGFLEKLVPAAVKISIGDGEKKVQNLRVGGTGQ